MQIEISCLTFLVLSDSGRKNKVLNCCVPIGLCKAVECVIVEEAIAVSETLAALITPCHWETNEACLLSSS